MSLVTAWREKLSSAMELDPYTRGRISRVSPTMREEIAKNIRMDQLLEVVFSAIHDYEAIKKSNPVVVENINGVFADQALRDARAKALRDAAYSGLFGTNAQATLLQLAKEIKDDDLP